MYLGSPVLILGGSVFLVVSVGVLLKGYVVFGAIMLALSTPIVWKSRILVLFLRFVSAEIKYDENGLSVLRGNSVQKYSWSDITAVRDHKFLEIIQFIDRNGKTALLMDSRCPGFVDFERFFREKISVNKSI